MWKLCISDSCLGNISYSDFQRRKGLTSNIFKISIFIILVETVNSNILKWNQGFNWGNHHFIDIVGKEIDVDMYECLGVQNFGSKTSSSLKCFSVKSWVFLCSGELTSLGRANKSVLEKSSTCTSPRCHLDVRTSFVCSLEVMTSSRIVYSIIWTS